VTVTPFAPIAVTLRQELLEYYRISGERLPAASWHNTLETNSGFVERRTDPLLDLYFRFSGRRTLRGVRVADLGCGFGALALYFAAHGASVRGIDPNGARLQVGQRVAEQHGLDVSLAAGRMEDLAFDDGQFDLAIQNNSFCYIVDWGDRRRALGETRRILRPEGHLLARNPNRLTPFDQFTGLPGVNLLGPRAADRTSRLLGRPRSKVRLLTTGSARRELRRAGFVDVHAVASPSSRWPSAVGWLARYQHLMARRPAGRRDV
jgi:SAM-dependent methyltransferase